MKPRAPLYVPAVFSIAAATLFLASPNSATAATQTWVNPTAGDWFTGSNWSGSVPAGGEDALLNNGGTAQIVNNFTPQLATVFVRNGGVAISGANSKLSNDISYVGYASNDNGTVGVSGAGSSWFSSQFYIGYSGNGSVSVSNGGKAIGYSGSTAYIGFTAQGNGSVTISGSGSKFNDSFYGATPIHIGEFGAGSVTLSNGGSMLGSSVSLGVSAGSRGTLNFGAYAGGDTAGTLTANAITFGAGTGEIFFNQTNGLTFSTPISGTGTVVQHGSGTTTLTGNQSFSGNTVVQSGTLILDGNLSSASNSVLVLSTLDARGTIAGATTISGGGSTLNLGNNQIGTLSINNNLILGSETFLIMELGGNGFGQYDQLFVGGTFNVASTVHLNVSWANGFQATEGDVFSLFTGSHASFSADRMVLPSFAPGAGLFWDTSQLGITGAISVVPEPAPTGLLVIAFGLCGLWRFRKQHSICKQ